MPVHPDDRIVYLDKLTYAGNLPALSPVMGRTNFRFVKAYICDREAVVQLFGVYNNGGHNEMQNIDIVKRICQLLNKPESLITYVADRKEHDMRYAIDPAKIHGELGWLPETRFEDGIRKTVRWYLENEAWWTLIISGEYQEYYEKMYGSRLRGE